MTDLTSHKTADDNSPHPATNLAVVAIGGNSLIADSSQPEIVHQWDAVNETTGQIAEMLESGWQGVVVTHGNGPQVGFILRRNELALGEVHTIPLTLVVADTQGSIGFMLQQALNNDFRQRKIQRETTTIITQTRVDENDPAFDSPSKPVYPRTLPAFWMNSFESRGWHVVENAGLRSLNAAGGGLFPAREPNWKSSKSGRFVRPGGWLWPAAGAASLGFMRR